MMSAGRVVEYTTTNPSAATASTTSRPGSITTACPTFEEPLPHLPTVPPELRTVKWSAKSDSEVTGTERVVMFDLDGGVGVTREQPYWGCRTPDHCVDLGFRDRGQVGSLPERPKEVIKVLARGHQNLI